jgi:hypothetical protein
MRKLTKTLIFGLFAITTYAQQATEIDSKSVKLPRYANLAAVTSAISTPAQGMLIYRNDTKSNWYFDGLAWKDMAVSSISVPSPLYLTSTSTTIGGETNQADEAGVLGINTTAGVGYGVLGKVTSTNPDENTVGAKGENMSTNGVGYGVMGRHEGTGWAGYFEGFNALKTQGKSFLGGDVNITGAIQTNGISGSANQVLQNNGNGTMSWIDKCDYKNSAICVAGNSRIFVVPSNVTKIWVELWGGGAGGNDYSGGGGGTYISIIVPVIPNSDFTVTAGTGGAGIQDDVANDGTASYFEYNSFSVFAYGGVAYDSPSSSAGTGLVIGEGLDDFVILEGERGQSISQRSLQFSATDFFQICEAGAGGNAGNSVSVGSKGLFISSKINGFVSVHHTPTKGLVPGGGGGAGGVLISNTGVVTAGFSGSNGGGGMVIIHY